VMVLVVELPCLGGRPVGLPVLFRLFCPKDGQHPDRRSQPELARELADIVIAMFPGRIVELVMDGAYASKAWQRLPDHVSVTTRMRANAAVYKLMPARTGKRGRPALKGDRLASLAKIAASAGFEAVTITGPDGRQRTAHVHAFVCLWYTPFHTRVITVILIRNPGREEGFDVALASTDTTAQAGELIARYDSRWTIETCHQEAKAHRRRPGPQPRPESRRADRPVRIPRPDDHDHLVSAARQPRHRPHRTPTRRAVVPPEGHHQLHRHARRAPARTDPPRILGTSTRRDHHTTNHARPVTVSPHRRLRPRKSS
jgi:Transposase DDE domain